MPSFSRGLEKVLHQAMNLARARSHEFATLEHLLLALADDRDTIKVLAGCDVDIEALKADLGDFINEELDSLVTSSGRDPRPTAAFQRCIQRATIHIQSSGKETVTGANVLVAIFAERESHAVYFLEQQDITRLDAVNFLNHGITKDGSNNDQSMDHLESDAYDQDLIETLKLAHSTAERARHANLTPEHFLLALLSSSPSAPITARLGRSPAEVLDTVAVHLGKLPATASGDPSRAVPLSAALSLSIKAALLQAASEDRAAASPVDVLDAILDIEGGIAGRIAGNAAVAPRTIATATSNAEVIPQVASPKPPTNRSPRLRQGKTKGFAFVSYAREDALVTSTVVRLLRERDITVWWDQDLSPGEIWRDAISTQLEGCKAHLVLWTKDSIASKPVCEEAGRGQTRGKLVHARLDDVQLPFGFAETQCISLAGWDRATVTPPLEALLQAVIDKLSPPSKSDLAARLMDSAGTAAAVVNGRIALVDAPPGVPPARNAPGDRRDRLRAQRRLANHIIQELDTDQKHNLSEAVPRCVRRYRDALGDRYLSWYSLDDALSALAYCRQQYLDEPWPGTTGHDVDQIVRRHRELEDLIRPRQPLASPDVPSPSETAPLVNPAKIANKPVEAAVEVATESIKAGEDAKLLDPSVGRAASRYAERLHDALLETGGDASQLRRYNGLRVGLRGLAALLANVTRATTDGLRSSALRPSYAAKQALGALTKALEVMLAFFRP